MTPAAPVAALVGLAVAAARDAGRELLRRQGAVGPIRTKSSPTDPVTAADRAAEELLVGALTAARPGDGLLGEEGAERTSTTGLRWVLDPLDGTVNYLYGLPGWCVSVACEEEGPEGWRGLVGVVHDPVRGETFTGVRGSGASADGRRLRVNDPVQLDRALIATGFAYGAADRARQAAVVAQLLPRVRDIRRGGSAAMDLCAVAAGRVDGYYEDTTSRWDWAAGALIAAEAGAVIAPLPGSGGGGVLAAGPALAGPLRDLVVGGGPPRPRTTAGG